jgi:hypothetical protein
MPNHDWRNSSIYRGPLGEHRVFAFSPARRPLNVRVESEAEGSPRILRLPPGRDPFRHRVRSPLFLGSSIGFALGANFDLVTGRFASAATFGALSIACSLAWLFSGRR